MTLQQLAEKIASNFPLQPKIISHVASDGFLHRSRLVPDVSLAQKDMGLTQKVSLNEAIKRTLLWHSEDEGNRI